MSFNKLHHDFGSMAEEDWQELAFSSVKDVQKLVRKTQDEIILKPLYTTNDILEHSNLLRMSSQVKTKAICSIDLIDDYKDLISLGVTNFSVGLDPHTLSLDELPVFGKDSHNFFIDLYQYPLIEAMYWKKRLAKHDKRYFLFDPLTHTLRKQKITRNFELLINDMFEFSQKFNEENFISVDGRYMKYLGINDIGELSHMLLIFKFYLDEAKKREFPLKGLYAKTCFKLSLGSEFFKNISKTRAFNLLLHRLFYREHNEIYDKNNFTVLAELDRSEFQYQDMHTNMLRETTASFSAQLGSVSFFQTTPFSKESMAKRLAANTYNIIQDEAFAQKVTDPAGGSYYLDQLTDQLVNKAWSEFILLEKKMFLKQYFFSGEFHQRCLKDQQTKVRDQIIGVNSFENSLSSKLEEDSTLNDIWESYEAEEVSKFKNINFNSLSSDELIEFTREIHDWEDLKNALGYIEFFQKTEKRVEMTPFRYGANHE